MAEYAIIVAILDRHLAVLLNGLSHDCLPPQILEAQQHGQHPLKFAVEVGFVAAKPFELIGVQRLAESLLADQRPQDDGYGRALCSSVRHSYCGGDGKARRPLSGDQEACLRLRHNLSLTYLHKNYTDAS